MRFGRASQVHVRSLRDDMPRKPVHVSAIPKRLVLSAALAVAAACSSSPAAAPGSTTAPQDAADARGGPLDDTLPVALGRSASVDAGRLVLTFVARLSDSRCPANVVCVGSGDVAQRVTCRADDMRVG